MLHVTTAAVYQIIPDDHYSTDDDSFTLQHYLNNVNKYCTSYNEIQFLPGKYSLTDELLIENVKNFSLTGNKTNGKISTTITCTAGSYGMAVINSSNIFIKDIIINECNLLDYYGWSLENASLLLQNSWHVSLLNVQLLRIHDVNEGFFSSCTLQALNILGNLILSNMKVNCLEIHYDQIDDSASSTNKLYINNYHSDYMGSNIHFISIIVYDALYDIEIVISNTVFTESPAIDFQCYGFQGHTSVIIKDCIFTNIRHFYGSSLANINMKNCKHKGEGLIKFSNCSFSDSKSKQELGEALVNVNIEADSDTQKSSNLRVHIISCKFYNIKTGSLISVLYDFTGNMRYTHFVYVVCEETTFDYIQLQNYSYAIYAQRLVLSLISVNFSHVDCDDTSAIISTVISATLWFWDYIEMFACTAANTAIIAEFIYITEFTVVNFTANNFPMLTHNQDYLADLTLALTPMMLLPCIFQYASYKNQNLDEKFKNGNELNYSIFFISNNIETLSLYKYSIRYCGWAERAAFTQTRPKLVNQNVIHYINDSLEYNTILKDICSCDEKYQKPGLPGFNCSTDELGPFYPGQTVEFHFITIVLPLFMERLLIRIEDGPEYACSSKNRSVITLLPFNVCTKIVYTVQHKSGKECDLYIKGVPQYKLGYSASPTQAMAEFFHVKLLPCPAGFTLLKSDGLCQCDPVLLMHVALVTTCNINDQSILRPPNRWITGTTINGSHTYNVSSSCPFDYCSPNSLHLNLLNPDSQCQFKRMGILCGQCHQGLSAVFGSSQCKKCSSIYLFLVIPIAIVGIALVMLLFIINLTVTDGDVNAFLFYVNIVSINTPVFFPKERFVKYTLVSLANLDLGIETCFYNGMDDYAMMWLQLTFPAYLIAIATTLIMASRHSIRIQRLTARRALPVLATLFLLSYTKVLRTISSVLFFYYEITNLPSKHTILVWSVDTSAALFGIKFTFIFIVSLCIFLILLFFNVILLFTRILSYFQFINRYKPLLDAYQGPYKDKYYFWTGFQLVMRAVFFGLSALNRNTNLMISSILIGTTACIHATLFPFKENTKNIQELLMMMNLNCLFIYSLYTSSNDITATVLIFVAFLQFSLIVINHVRVYLLSIRSVNLAKMKLEDIFKNIFDYFNSPAPNNTDQGNLQLIPEVAYNFREFREPLIGQDF